MTLAGVLIAGGMKSDRIKLTVTTMSEILHRLFWCIIVHLCSYVVSDVVFNGDSRVGSLGYRWNDHLLD